MNLGEEDFDEMEEPCICPVCRQAVELSAMRELRSFRKLVCANCYDAKIREMNDNMAPNRT